MLSLGTICATDPSKLSCFDPGDSGSGLMMERFQGGYSWEGVLSFYRGCDQRFTVSAAHLCSTVRNNREFSQEIRKPSGNNQLSGILAEISSLLNVNPLIDRPFVGYVQQLIHKTWLHLPG